MVKNQIKRLPQLRVFNDENGMTLIEVLVTIGIMGVALVTFTVALSTGSLAVSESDQEVTTQGLAQTQMEYTKGYPYDPGATTYPTISPPDGYAIAVAVSPVAGADTNIQKVTANISRDGQLLLTLEDYKVNR
ncbi:MAG: hypothetical protein A2144_04825 [Chloroflexi bacterium RBG_16_50_9]|nr:MAG: hypothetical protein A2144_04825 [Chloroflexi bacterium RBG_16_50_9]